MFTYIDFARAVPGVRARNALLVFVLSLIAMREGLPVIRVLAGGEAKSQGATVAAQLPISSAFTYQGMLMQDGMPVDGVVQVQFRLWDAEATGNLIGTVGPVPVTASNGSFFASLDFGTSAFAGQRRWMEMLANGTSLGRVELTASPYALYSAATAPHSHFGEAWTGTSSFQGLRVENAGTGITIYGNNTGGGTGIGGDSTSGIGVFGKTQTGLAGLYGETSNAGSNAIFGRSFAPGGPAITGIADDPNSTNDGVGVQGSSGGAPHAPNGPTGVSASSYGQRSFGIDSYALGTDAIGANIEARGLNAAGMYVYGDSSGIRSDSQGTGIRGRGFIGVEGQGYGPYGTGDGVLGQSEAGFGVVAKSRTNYAVYAATRDGFAAIWGRANVNESGNEGVGVAKNGVYGQSWAPDGSGVIGRNEGSGAGVTGYSVAGLAGDFLGNVRIWGQVLPPPSDLRLKHDVTSLGDGLAAVLALKPVTYAWNDHPQWEEDGHLHNGFIAQDVQDVLPSTVYFDSESGTLRLSYDEIIPVLARAIQEMHREIETTRSPQSSTAKTARTAAGPSAWVLQTSIAAMVIAVIALSLSAWLSVRNHALSGRRNH